MSANCLKDTDVVILAGGLGTRLRSLFPDLPKCLVPVNGIPFLGHYLNWLHRFGVQRIILSLGHKSEMIQAYLKVEPQVDMEIETFVESSPLGTGGALRAALPLVRSGTVLVTNGDSLTCADLCAFKSFHINKKAEASILLTRSVETKASGVVETDENDAVTAFSEKPTGATKEPAYINAGMYLMEREAILEIPPDKPVSLERDIFPDLCGRHFYALKGAFPFIDIGTPETYSQAAAFFEEQSA